MSEVTPILRIFDETKAKEFYIGFLGFRIDWEHRFEPDLPLYMQVSRDGCVLHLSEHYGDASPGSAIRIRTDNVAAYHAGLLAQAYRYARPGLERTPWDAHEMSIRDPFGNRLTWYEPVAKEPTP